MTELLNKDQVRDELREIISGREDYIYPQDKNFGCVMWTDKDGRIVDNDSFTERAPSCLVGYWLDKHDLLGEVDFGASVYTCRNILDLFVDNEAREYLADVQHAQDTGTPWGKAVNQNYDY